MKICKFILKKYYRLFLKSPIVLLNKRAVMRPVWSSGLSDVSGIKIFFFALDLQAAFVDCVISTFQFSSFSPQLQILDKSLKLLQLMEGALVFKYLVTLILPQFICVSGERKGVDLQLAFQGS